MSSLDLSDLCAYLFYGSTAIEIFLLLQRGDRLESSESDVYGRQILTTEVDPRAVRVNTTRHWTNVSSMLPTGPTSRCGHKTK